MYWFDIMWGNNGHGNGWVGMAPIGEEMSMVRHRDNLINISPDDCEIMQYTGIKFNDAELYEGDIIEWHQRPEGYPQDPNKVRKTKVIELSNLIAGCFLYNFYDYKIIGNIHQNTELL